jgi:hypothetical protein
MSNNPCCGKACRYWTHLTDAIGLCGWTTEAAPEWIKGGAVSREGDYAGCKAFEVRPRVAGVVNGEG